MALLEQWPLIENDLQDRGVDLDDPAIAGRPWRWLRTRIVGCLSDPDSRIARHFTPDEQQHPTR